MIKRYKSSICSTCKHAHCCSLTALKEHVNSCSEYVHFMDFDVNMGPLYIESDEMIEQQIPREVKEEPQFYKSVNSY